MTHDRGIEKQVVETAAANWLMSQRDPAFDDWEGFADWLAADPVHQDIYYELAALDADLADLPVQSKDVAANDVAAAKPFTESAATRSEGTASNVVPIAPRRISRRAWLGGAIAASLVAIVGVGMVQQSSDSYRVQTAMGEMQIVALADGSEIAVNGGSSVLLSHADPRRVTLESGQMLLTVVHSDTAPFRVKAGAAELVDVGTVFDVTHVGDVVTVAVSEGAVVYNPGAQNVRINAGHRLIAQNDGRSTDLAQVNPESVGGWRGGQLVYDGVPLGDVAAELARTTGVNLRTTPASATILFRGALRTDLDEARLVSDLAALSGTSATKDSGGWTLSR